MKKLLFLALLMVGVCAIPCMAVATDSDPDNADGLDIHDNTVVEGLAMAVADISSGNTVQVGPVGGVYEGSHSVTQGGTSVAAYSGACVLTSVTYTPSAGNSVYSGTASAQAISGYAVVTGLSVSADDGAGDYVELYNGTARGSHANCLLDVEGGTANATALYNGPPIEFSANVYAYSSTSMPFRLSYLNDDYLEIYDGTARGGYSTCLLDIKGSAADGTIVWTGAPIEFTTGIYAYNSNQNATWQVQYRIEDQSE